MPVALQPFRWWHIDEVMPLERELFTQWAWTHETYWTELAAPDRWYAVARDEDGILCGWVGLAGSGGDGDVQTIAVSPAAQGTGVGRVLLSGLLAEAERRGLGRVMLEVRADNVPAQKLYEKCGFSQIAVRRRYYQPGDVDALIMRRRLGEDTA